jgi:hypothetical protein
MVICAHFSPRPVLLVPWVSSLSCVIVPPVVHRWCWGVLWSSKHLLSTLRAVARSGGGGCRVPSSCPFRCHLGSSWCPCSSWFLSLFVVLLVPRRPALALVVLPSMSLSLASPVVLGLFCLGFFVTPLIPQHLPSSFCRPAVARRPRRCSPVVFAFPRRHCSRLCGCVGRQSRCCK